MTKKIVFLAKTNLNTDGRILNQLNILNDGFPETIVNFILFPDKPTTIKLSSNVNLIELNSFIRNNRILRPLTVLVFIFKAILELRKIRPNIIHAQDSASVLPVYIYGKYIDRDVKIIYDDHELPNEKQGLQEQFITYIEEKLIKKQAHVVLFANMERQEYLVSKLGLASKKTSVFLNLPYAQENVGEGTDLIDSANYSQILEEKHKGVRFIIHQGPLNSDRHKELVASVARLMDHNVKIMILGSNINQFNAFLSEFQLSSESFFFVGSIPYNLLPYYWRCGEASLVFYNPKFLNNKLCAPNRYFMSLFSQIPVIINNSNPVLNNLNLVFKSGIPVENILDGKNKLSDIFNVKVLIKTFTDIEQNETSKFIDIYQELLD